MRMENTKAVNSGHVSIDFDDIAQEDFQLRYFWNWSIRSRCQCFFYLNRLAVVHYDIGLILHGS